MKQIEFNEVAQDKKYDQYGAFWKPLVSSHYWHHGQQIVAFETGEVRINPRHPNLHDRREYDSLGVELWASGDATKHKFETPIGEKVPNAWLFHRGRQMYFLIDHTLGMAVKLAGWTDRAFESGLPNHLKGCSAYYPNSNAHPIGVPVPLSMPNDLTRKKEFTEWAREVKAACAVLHRIDAAQTPYWYSRGSYVVGLKDVGSNPGDYAASLSNDGVARVARFGMTLARQEVETPYLKLIA